MPNSGHFSPFSAFPWEQILICPRDSPTHLSACSSSNGYMQHVATLNAVSVSLHMHMASMRHQVHVSHSKVHLLPVQCGMLGSRTMSRAGMQQRTTSMMSSSIRVHHLRMLAYSGSATVWYRPSAPDVLERAVGWAPSSWSAVEQGEQWVSEVQSTNLGCRRVAT